jgi:hypothetical protein
MTTIKLPTNSIFAQLRAQVDDVQAPARALWRRFM